MGKLLQGLLIYMYQKVAFVESGSSKGGSFVKEDHFVPSEAGNSYNLPLRVSKTPVLTFINFIKFNTVLPTSIIIKHDCIH